MRFVLKTLKNHSSAKYTRVLLTKNLLYTLQKISLSLSILFQSRNCRVYSLHFAFGYCFFALTLQNRTFCKLWIKKHQWNTPVSRVFSARGREGWLNWVPLWFPAINPLSLTLRIIEYEEWFSDFQEQYVVIMGFLPHTWDLYR